MAISFEKTLVIGISATALFDLSDSDELFKKETSKDPHEGLKNYRKHMLKNEEDPLEEGIGGCSYDMMYK